MIFVESAYELLSKYKAVICDVWGVLHNGVDVFHEAHKLLFEYRKIGGVVILVSNAPRPSFTVLQQLQDLKVPCNIADKLITSGDLTLNWLRTVNYDPIYWIGAKKDTPLFEGLTLNFTDSERARYILCTGLNDDTLQTPEDFRSNLEVAAARNLPFICANPDLKVEKGSQIIYCAGAVAQLYKSLGGEIIYYGKPYEPIYEAAFSYISSITSENISKKNVIAVGDGLLTDILGAKNYGIDALLVTAGLHSNEFSGSLSSGDLLSNPLLKPYATCLKAVTWKLA